ncbi:AraC family transcriptional regulator [Neptuniibacter halophilus]|uniref:AraC family transcriptional regulator n=1 Tax=Neptuniibacter halophilus TaxID=651666 RepID=UPI0025736C61|nr:AraC family transcriptional regulator [Neptuniibacter halophilus]
MSKETIRNTAFTHPQLMELGIELLSWTQLQPKLAQGPERVEFYMLLLVTSGRGRHKLDFIDHELHPGSLLFLRPGQVQEWQSESALEAGIILIEPSALPQAELSAAAGDGLALLHWPNFIGLGVQAFQEIGEGFAALQRDFDRFSGKPLDMALIRQQLLCLLIRVARLQQGQQHPLSDRSGKTYRRFRDLLEQHYAEAHQLSFYASRLGYAESTLSRACLRAEGRSAKVVIDRRIALEAKRLLAHSRASVGEIGLTLGFTETTNFSKFFRRLEGITPQAFRQQRLA